MKNKSIKDYTIAAGDENSSREIEAELLKSLRSRLPQSTNTGFSLEIRDDSNDLIGGLSGSTSYGWLLVKTLWVKDEYRGTGLGRSLMVAAEAKAGELKCHSIWLDTSNPDALHFYQALGYEVFGEIANTPDQYPPDHCRWFMKKPLSE